MKPSFVFYTGDKNWRDHGAIWIKQSDDKVEIVEFCNIEEFDFNRYEVREATLYSDDLIKNRSVKDALEFVDIKEDDATIKDLAYALYSCWGYGHLGGSVIRGNNAYQLLRYAGIYRP